MLIWINIYLIIILAILVLLGINIPRLKIRRPFRFIAYITSLMALPLIIVFICSAYLINLAPISEINIPNVEGRSLEEAEEILRNLSLESSVISKVQSVNIEEGKVISQSPEGNKRAKVGRRIGLIVSLGKAKIIMPRLIGKNLDQAIAILREIGLEIGEVKKIYSREYDSNTIVAQSPLAGEEIETGLKIDLNIAVNPDDLPEEPSGGNNNE